MKTIHKNCECCDYYFSTKRSHTKFCSASCRSEHWKRFQRIDNSGIEKGALRKMKACLNKILGRKNSDRHRELENYVLQIQAGAETVQTVIDRLEEEAAECISLYKLHRAIIDGTYTPKEDKTNG